MAVRTSLAALITRTRQLIFDTGGTPVFTDDQIQTALDVRRTDVRYAALRPLPTFQANGNIVYLDFYSDIAPWEDDYQLQDLSYTTITASVTLYEPLVGHWAFATQPNGVAVRITGKVYDLYGAAADLLEQWAATLKLGFDFSSDDQRFRMDQQGTMIIETAARYRALAWPRSMRSVQGDAASDYQGEAIVYPRVGGGTEYT